jgi:ABC-type Zn uptake system ZnuABC Zn-binding protein ZnuA/ABC-type Mn2+/Zn2+ transport system permease subunit
VWESFRLPFVQRALVEVAFLSVGAGVLGSWVVLRGRAFFTHAVGTAAFPGLVLADGLGFSSPAGAFGAALLFAAGTAGLTRGRRGDDDSMTALALVGALVTGVILASDVFHSGSNIETLLFGSLLTTGTRDILLAAVTSALVLVASLTLGRRWLAFGFDDTSATTLGIGAGWSESALLVLIALVVVASLSVAGALLATALLTIPAATARLWSRRFVRWQVLSVALVAAEGALGVALSIRTNAPPGAAIAALSGAVFAVSVVARAVTRRRTAAAAIATAICLTGFGAVAWAANGPAPVGDGSVRVVATTTQIGDWVRNVGGDAVALTQILQPNSDPHDYEPRPNDIEATASADVVFENGDDLDAWMTQVVADSGGSPTVVDLGADLPVTLPGETGGPEASRFDPHWWHDPVNAEAAVRQIRDALAAADPSREAVFDTNADAYLAKLRALDRGIAACVDQVQAAERKLVTDHDAFAYFAQRYAISVIGAVIPSQTTQGEPSAGELADLVALIEREHVRAVFPEASLNAKLTSAIAEQSGASADYTLYGDTLGTADSSGGTYLTMEAANADQMVKGFSGGTASCAIGGIG